MPDIIEHESYASFLQIVDLAEKSEKFWGLATIKRPYLRPVTKEALQHSIQPIFENEQETHVLFVNADYIYIAWCGQQKSVFLKLLRSVSTVFTRPGLDVEATTITSYRDLRVYAGELKEIFKVFDADRLESEESFMFPDEEKILVEKETPKPEITSLKILPETTAMFQEVKAQRSSRKQLQILVVEDEVFSQKLLCEILRGVRSRYMDESPVIEIAQGIQEAWKYFLKKAPDITFIDLNLLDGSGHTLARAIKEIDLKSTVAIVTANNYDEEEEIARQNNVDFFVAKPFNKKQILDCINKHIDRKSPAGKAEKHGSFA